MKKDKIIFTGLIISLCIGSITPVHDFRRTIKNTIKYRNDADFFQTVPCNEVLNQSNFSGSTYNNFFFEHIARQPEQQLSKNK